jgi:hypothetical protein
VSNAKFRNVVDAALNLNNLYLNINVKHPRFKQKRKTCCFISAIAVVKP